MVKVPPGTHSIDGRGARASVELGKGFWAVIGLPRRPGWVLSATPQGAPPALGLQPTEHDAGCRICAKRLQALEPGRHQVPPIRRFLMRMVRMTGAVAAVALISTLGVVPSALGKPAPPPPPVDPDAVSALQTMGDFLRKQQMFSVQSRMTTDDVMKSGQKVQYGATVD